MENLALGMIASTFFRPPHCHTGTLLPLLPWNAAAKSKEWRSRSCGPDKNRKFVYFYVHKTLFLLLLPPPLLLLWVGLPGRKRTDRQHWSLAKWILASLSLSPPCCVCVCVSIKSSLVWTKVLSDLFSFMNLLVSGHLVSRTWRGGSLVWGQSSWMSFSFRHSCLFFHGWPITEVQLEARALFFLGFCYFATNKRPCTNLTPLNLSFIISAIGIMVDA